MNSPVHGTTSGIDRRTVLRTGAWAVPAIALAVGAPAASASDTGAVTFRGGDYSYTNSFFNTALTQRSSVQPGLSFDILNGSTPIPSGSITVAVEFDRFAYQSSSSPEGLVTLDFGGTRTPLDVPITVDATTGRMLFSIPVEVPAQGQSANSVYVNVPFLNTAPNDVYDQYVPAKITIQCAVGGGTPQTTVLGPYVPTVSPATPWGYDFDTNLATYTSGACSVLLPASGSIRSYGPNPTPESILLFLDLDDRAISGVTATIDGVTHQFVHDALKPTAWVLDLGVLPADYSADLVFDYAIDPAIGFGPMPMSGSSGPASRRQNAYEPFSRDPNRRLTVNGFYGGEATCA